MAVNVTANWHLIRTLDPLLRASDAGRVVFVTSAVAYKAKPYFGLYATSKAALDTLARTYASECANTNVRVNLFAPGQTATRMILTAYPGIDPQTLPTAEEVSAAILPLCLPNCQENGRVYDFPAKSFQDFRLPA